MTFRDYSDLPLRGRAAAPEHGHRRRAVYRDGAKRCLDILLVVLSLPISLPLILGMMGLVALEGGNPLYCQKRLGRGGRLFRLIKIRTMVPGAEALLAAHLDQNSEARREWVETQKLKCDPRTTRIGRFLRKSSLDELPQLWNVLKGDMSLVGPRPMMPEQERLYPGTAYFDLRPGITGLWQISERNETSFAERAGFDNRYLSSLSLSLDLSILLRTVSVVLRGTGY
ncbi:sugar transferase [Roseovarius autotrophicus]|uniref:sugar transferase n=1 Tax=Roseovarius autotrophicus TaxID=2824121 RepID=UPI0019DB3F62|nr:sugar transferase [Roseovarius autotrophicus]MBE0454239.1 sugar transferase [Roseovarius sp.]